jgi:hypothetical protein
MASQYLGGFLGTTQAGVEARNDVTVAVKNWFANRNPLATRLPYVPVDRVDFLMYGHNYRPVSGKLGAGISSTGTTTITLDDTSFLMMHDLLEFVDPVNGTEVMQVSADPASATTVAVIRGVAGTSALGTIANNTPYFLYGNSRTGAEVTQTGLVSTGLARTQYCQTHQFPVQIGGSAQTARAQVFPGGIQSPFDFNMTMQLQNMIDSVELTAYYGRSQAPVDSPVTTAKSNGLRSILTTNMVGVYNSSVPTNAAAYGPQDLIRDTLQASRTNGGEVDLLVLSTNFMSGLATWGMAVQRLPAGETIFGTPIDVFECPFLHGVTIVEAPLLRPYTAIALTSSEVYMRVKRHPYWNMRGNRGDMMEGDWICELAVEVVNEAHHAWVDSITAFSAA